MNIPPGKVFDEKMEREIANIVGRCSTRVQLPGHPLCNVVEDTSMLVVELMEYIALNYDIKKVNKDQVK